PIRLEANDSLLRAFSRPAAVVDPYQGVALQPAVRDGRPGIVTRTSGEEQFNRAVWVLGASPRGYTFLCEDPEGRLTEGRISYYPLQGGWRFTPGQPNPEPTPYPIGRRGVEEACL